MATSYWVADDNIKSLVQKAIDTYHHELMKAGVKVGVIMAFSGKENVSPVKRNGYPAYATIKVVPLRDRITKDCDAEICLDAESWRGFSEAQKMALLDHELSHINVKKKKARGPDGKPVDTSEVLFDDINRPLLKSIKGDWNVGDGFANVVSRHKENSIEYVNIQQAKKLADEASEN